MDTVGIVGEYNPFHSGHEYHLERTREVLGGDCAVVCVMSGDFVQRGEAAAYSNMPGRKPPAAVALIWCWSYRCLGHYPRRRGLREAQWAFSIPLDNSPICPLARNAGILISSQKRRWPLSTPP